MGGQNEREVSKRSVRGTNRKQRQMGKGKEDGVPDPGTVTITGGGHPTIGVVRSPTQRSGGPQIDVLGGGDARVGQTLGQIGAIRTPVTTSRVEQGGRDRQGGAGRMGPIS